MENSLNVFNMKLSQLSDSLQGDTVKEIMARGVVGVIVLAGLNGLFIGSLLQILIQPTAPSELLRCAILYPSLAPISAFVISTIVFVAEGLILNMLQCLSSKNVVRFIFMLSISISIMVTWQLSVVLGFLPLCGPGDSSILLKQTVQPSSQLIFPNI